MYQPAVRAHRVDEPSAGHPVTSVGGPRARHVALLYRSPGDLAERAAPPIREGLARGEAVLVCLDQQKWRMLAQRLGTDAGRVTYLPAEDGNARPVERMALLWSFVSGQVAAGASAVQAIGELDFDGTDDGEWIHYDAAINDVFAGLPLKATCAYDTIALPDDIVEAACAVHPHLATGDGVHASATYAGPAAAPVGRRATLPAPARPPDLELHGVTQPRLARHAAADLVGAHASTEALQALDVVLSELVTNAVRHAGTAARLSLWHEPGSVIAVVADDGPGIDDPFAGLRPPSLPERGAGLWIANRFSRRFAIDRAATGGTSVIAEIDLHAGRG